MVKTILITILCVLSLAARADEIHYWEVLQDPVVASCDGSFLRTTHHNPAGQNIRIKKITSQFVGSDHTSQGEYGFWLWRGSAPYPGPVIWADGMEIWVNGPDSQTHTWDFGPDYITLAANDSLIFQAQCESIYLPSGPTPSHAWVPVIFIYWTPAP